MPPIKNKYTLKEMERILQDQCTRYEKRDGSLWVDGERVLLESPVIELDLASPRAAQLRKKLAEYEARMAQRTYMAPEIQFARHTPYQREVLKALLETGRVVAWDLSREMKKRVGIYYRADNFSRAAQAIHSYAETGWSNGVELPEVEE